MRYLTSIVGALLLGATSVLGAPGFYDTGEYGRWSAYGYC